MSRNFSVPPAITVHLLREGIIESCHEVEAVLCDRRGRIRMAAGMPDSSAFIRSALKPFQALAIVGTGTLEAYGLSDRDLAICCASHDGSIPQARQAFHILWRSGVETSALRCPTPSDQLSPLNHNCSGKHAGMLAVCQQCNWSTREYMDPKHPVQQLILKKIAECLGLPPAELIGARDDCGVPTYYMQIRQMAALYAHLSGGDRLDMERITRAMTHYPELVAGEGQFDTELMRLTEGTLVSKSGAEGVQCLGQLGQGLGLAIKVKDGAKRAKYAVAIRLLQQLGWIQPAIAQQLAEQFLSLSSVKRLEVVGDLAMV
ncbi:MAG: asparaginase [Synechococcales cyanobacterium RM1_1_8]|nr:asparaginase [Synechococcales cyanobacterium RM1_1_8]